MVKILKAIIDWSERVRIINTKEYINKILISLSKIPREIIEKLCSFPKDSIKNIDKVLKEDNQKPINFELSLNVDKGVLKEFNEAVDYSILIYMKKEKLH